MSTPLEEPNPSYSSKDSSIDESTFEEDYNKFEREQLEPTELYNKIGAPVPLPVKASEGASDIQTVFNLDFAKLPMGMKSVSVSANDDKIILPKKSTKRVEIPVESVPNEDGTQRVTASTQTQTLYSMYPKQDPRLVYLKYKEHGDWEIKNKGYASYLANVENLLKSKSLKAQYQVESGENPGNRQLEGSGKTGGEIQFNSLFESGNLYAAFQVSDLEYDLVLQNDINTRGHTQWFFFSVQNVPKDKAVKFNIVNLLKPDSLFSEGMKPVVFSSVQHESDGSGWTRSGFDISYSKNSLTKENDYAKTYYTLSFSYTFKHANDTVYFAHSFPYTYSDLKDFLQKISTDENTKIHVTRRTLCYTLSKNKCEYVSITSPYNLQEVEKRVGIAITARQHPGESLSSYIMEGAIEFLVSNQPEAQFLRNHCVFKIVPMLNPDGVIHGNYRASLCGRDLNRNWTKPNPILQPTIYHTKELVRRLQAKRSLALFCDLHGHSRKKNAFFYGNATSENPWGARMFPFLLSKSCKYASFEDSRFTIQKSKENTARIALWKEFKIDNIFTLEASFYGYKHEGMIKHFTKEDYKNLGVDLCKAMHVYIKQITLRVTIPRPVPDSDAVKDRNGGKQLDPAFGAEVRRRSLSVPENHEAKVGKAGSAFDCMQLMAELKSNKKLMEVGNKDDDSGSGTDNSEDDIPMKYLQKVLPIKSITKRKKVKSLDPNKKKPVVKKDEKKDEKKEEKKDERQSPFAKLYSSLERPKAGHKLYKRLSQVNREPFKDCMFLEDETTKDVEMVSQASQTDEYLSRVLDYQESPVLMKGKQPMYRPLNGGYDQKAWFTYQGEKAYRSKSPQPLTEDQLFVVGAKTGLELHSTIDVTYKLKKNQISRSILARLNSKVFEREQEKDQVEIVKGRGSEALVIFSSQQGLVKGITSSNNRLYNSCQKEDSRYMSVQCIDKISPSPSPLLEKVDGFKGDTQKYISSRLLAREESEKRKSLSQKAMIGKEIISLAPSLMAGQKSTQRMISKDRLLGPLPQLLNMHTGKILSKEALVAGLIGTSSLPKKVKSNGESQHDESYFRSRLSRITPQGPGTNPLPSSREVSVRLGKRRERASQGVMREAYPETQIYETSNNNTSGVKNQSMSPSKTRVSRLDNLLLGDIKPDYDKKNLEVELLNLKKGRKSQSTIIRKL